MDKAKLHFFLDSSFCILFAFFAIMDTFKVMNGESTSIFWIDLEAPNNIYGIVFDIAGCILFLIMTLKTRKSIPKSEMYK